MGFCGFTVGAGSVDLRAPQPASLGEANNVVAQSAAAANPASNTRAHRPARRATWAWVGWLVANPVGKCTHSSRCRPRPHTTCRRVEDDLPTTPPTPESRLTAACASAARRPTSSFRAQAALVSARSRADGSPRHRANAAALQMIPGVRLAPASAHHHTLPATLRRPCSHRALPGSLPTEGEIVAQVLLLHPPMLLHDAFIDYPLPRRARQLAGGSRAARSWP